MEGKKGKKEVKGRGRLGGPRLLHIIFFYALADGFEWDYSGSDGGCFLTFGASISELGLYLYFCGLTGGGAGVRERERAMTPFIASQTPILTLHFYVVVCCLFAPAQQ